MGDDIPPANQLANIDQAGKFTFQCPVLTSTNYPIWSLRIKAIFKAHGIWEMIEPGTNIDLKKDSAATAYLYQALPEDLVLQIANCETAKEIWDAIKTRHLGVERVMEARLQALKTELDLIRMKEGTKVDDFVGKLSGIASKSATLGSPIDEEVLVRKLLISVPENFVNMAATIEQLVDLKTVKFQEVVGRLKAYEERTSAKTNNSSSDHLLLTYQEWDSKRKQEKGYGRGRGNGQDTRGRGRGRGRSGGRGRGSNRSQNTQEGNQCSYNPIKDRSKLQCFRCDAFGHFSADCPTRKKEEKAHLTQATMAQANADKPALLMAVANQVQKELIYVNEEKVFPEKYRSYDDGEFTWYLDTGATNHMTGNKGLFSTLDTDLGGTVRFGDNSSVEIRGKGSVLLACKNGEQRLLTDVLYIPYLKSNIFSIGQAEEGGCEILIKQGCLSMFESDGTLLMKVQRSPNRLYKIILKVGTPICLQAKLDDKAWLWHARLGHVNFDTIKRLGTSDLVKGVPAINHPTQVCEACLAGKHSRKSFPDQTTFRAARPLEQVYADLCGPITPATQSGNRYILLIVDDHSRFMWTFMLKTKDEAFEQFKKFKAFIENQYGTKIKVLRTDRGGEFTSNEFKNFCELAGITRQLTAPYTPQQNGIVERRNRTVLSTTRSILKAMDLPQSFWGEAVRHSVYILNRLPTKFLKNQTPYEALEGRKPNLDHLRVFGCVGHVKVPSNQVGKLDDRSVPMVYLGTEPGTKAYRMYNPEERRLVISRDVKFDEARKWDWHLQQDVNQGLNHKGDFVVYVTPTEHGSVVEGSESEPAEPNSPFSPSVNDQQSSSTSAGEESAVQSEFSSPETTVKGRGPMLSRLPTDCIRSIYGRRGDI